MFALMVIFIILFCSSMYDIYKLLRDIDELLRKIEDNTKQNKGGKDCDSLLD